MKPHTVKSGNLNLLYMGLGFGSRLEAGKRKVRAMWLSGLKRITLEMDGVGMDCARFGNGSKALVLIPGLTLRDVKGAELPLAYMYRMFAREHTVYVLDKRSVIPDGYTIRDLANDAAHGMEQLGLSDADVFGVSQGGMIGQYLAIDHPHLVHKLVLSVTASRRNPVMEEAVGNWVRMAERGDFELLVMDIFERMYSEAYLRKYHWLFPILTRLGKPRDPGRFIALAKACLTCNSYPELRKITCPALVIGGRQDYVVTGEASEELAAALQCELHMYDGLGHSAYEEAADHNERIVRFLAE